MAKFALPMKDGVAVSTMAELREHFDLKKAIRYLGNGRLMKWLRDRGYDEEADKLEDLRGNVAQIDRLEFAQRLCSVLGMIFDKTKIDPKELEGLMEFGRKADKLAQYTNDTDILGNADRAAFDQGDLDKLAKDTIPEIYLCNGEFTIPLEATGKKYYGIGNVVAVIPSDEYVDFAELRITFDDKYKVKFDEKYVSIHQAGTIEQQKENHFCVAQKAYEEDDYAKAIEEFRKAADMGHVKAMTNLGRLYYEEKTGDAIEASEAVKWLECAAAEHDTDAMQLLSDMYSNGRGVEKSEEKAFHYLKDAVEGAEDPSKESLYVVGHSYRLGLGTDKDSEKAQNYLQKAAELGNSDAMNELGLIHKNAYDIFPNPQDAEEATSWFKKAARAGNESSMLSLGRWREEREDYKEAADWYREAMKAGNSEGKFRLGCLYLEGKGIQKDEKIAFNLIKDVAENNADAMNCLGYLYDHGRGVVQDKKQAMDCYQKAADLGYTDAMYATRQSILSLLSNQENINKHKIMSELIYKVDQAFPFMPRDIKWGEIFAKSTKSSHFSYNGSIEETYFIDDLVKQKAVEYADIICYLCDTHFTYAGGIVFTQNGIIDYQIESQKWFYFPYQAIQAVHYGKKFLSMQVFKAGNGEKYDFEQDFGGRGWNAHHIGVFIEVVIGIKPVKSQDQELIKGINIESLNGENIIDYLK